MKKIINLLKLFFFNKDTNNLKDKSLQFKYSYKKKYNFSNHKFFNKNPHWEKVFRKFVKEEILYINFLFLKKSSDMIKKNHKILHKYGITPQKYRDSDFSMLMHDLFNFNKEYKADKILKEKYVFLKTTELVDFIYNNSSINFNEYFKYYIREDINKDNIIKDLKDYISTLYNFKYELVLKKIIEDNIELLYDNKKIIIIKIDNYKKLKNFGSKSWCIKNNKYSFSKFIGNNHLYIMYDFDKFVNSFDSIIGYTVDPKTNTILDSYDNRNKKNNNYLFIKNIINVF